MKWIKDDAERKYQEMLKTPLTFTAEEPGAKLSLVSSNGPVVTLETSQTGEEGSWTPYTVGTEITLTNVGDKIMFRNSSDTIQAMSEMSSRYNYFKIDSGKIAASGNVMFLMDKTGELRDLSGKSYCYNYIFSNCKSLTQAPALPATTLASSCYQYMFNCCTSLTQAPDLPATTLANKCYSNMFNCCTSLTQAPALPATTIEEQCYNGMFKDCTSLTKAPDLLATTLYYTCYLHMFNGCTKLNAINVNFSAWDPEYNATSSWVLNVAASGTFTCPADLPEEFGESRIPTGWTVVRK